MPNRNSRNRKDLVIPETGTWANWPTRRPAKRALRRLEATSVQEDDPMVLSEPERQVERVDVLLQVLHCLVADVFAGPELEVDQPVIAVVVRVRGELQAQAVDQALEAPLDDLHARLLVGLL